MKRILAIFLPLLLLLSLTACGAKEDVEYYVTRRYVQQPTGDINLMEYTYDDQWNILSTNIQLNGEFASAAEYTYSEDYTVVTMRTTSAIYDSATTEVHRTFDEDGNIIKALAYDNGELTTTAEYFYDEQGREVKVVNTAATGYVNTVEHIYDENGNLLTYIANTGYTVTRQEFTYDDQNRRISAEYYQNDQLTNRINYTYENNVQKGLYYDAAGTELRTTLAAFDEAGNLLTEEVYDILGTLQSRTCYAYIGTDGSTSSGIPE